MSILKEPKKNQKVFINLSKKDKEALKRVVKVGKKSARIIMRANILLLMNKGYSSNDAAELLQIYPETARSIAVKYNAKGLLNALEDKPRPGKARTLNKKQSSEIIATVCSDPPNGRARWTLRLIAEESVKRGIVPKVGKDTIRILLKSHDLKPWREKNVVHSDDNPRIQREDV